MVLAYYKLYASNEMNDKNAVFIQTICGMGIDKENARKDAEHKMIKWFSKQHRYVTGFLKEIHVAM